MNKFRQMVGGIAAVVALSGCGEGSTEVKSSITVVPEVAARAYEVITSSGYVFRKFTIDGAGGSLIGAGMTTAEAIYTTHALKLPTSCNNGKLIVPVKQGDIYILGSINGKRWINQIQGSHKRSVGISPDVYGKLSEMTLSELNCIEKK